MITEYHVSGKHILRKDNSFRRIASILHYRIGFDLFFNTYYFGNNISGLIIGLVVAGIILFSGPISGGSFNPARSFAPALVSGNLSALWIYIIAPTVGSVLAMLVWKGFNKTE